MSSRSVLTKWAIVVKCGAVMPHNAMNVTCSWAHPVNGPAAHDALGVGEEHHLEQHGRRICGRAGRVVLEARVEVGQIDFVIEQVVQRLLERAGQQLARQVDAQELRIRIDHFVAGHGRISTARRNDTTFDAGPTRRVLANSVSTLACFGTFPTASVIAHAPLR